jgi:hypothetical protein
MTISSLLRRIRAGNEALYATGWANAAIFAACALLLLLDSREVMGVNAWLKPMKFALSITLYAWTAALVLPYLQLKPRLQALLGGTISLLMMAEISLILLQAGRGVRSHFNFATEFDAGVFGLMGLLIGLNTLLVLFICLRLLTQQPPALGRPLWHALQAAWLIFFLASGVGGMMIAQGGHAIGVPDGGPGLPLLNWSTQGGDLRAAHFWGLHSIQLIPLAALLIQRKVRSRRAVAWGTYGSIALYAAVFAALLALARQGVPVWG